MNQPEENIANLPGTVEEKNWRVGYVSIEKTSTILDDNIRDDFITWQDKLFTEKVAKHEVIVDNETERRHNLHHHPDMRTRWIARPFPE